jgi:timeless protein
MTWSGPDTDKDYFFPCRTVLSIETVAYLTYEGVRFFEELELAIQEKRDRVVDLRPHLRRIHLIVTALRAFIQTLQAYLNFAHFSEVDKEKLRKLQMAVCSMRDLRQLFLLLIRRYNSSLHTRQYLNDVIC